MQSGQYFKAIASFSKALEKDPDIPAPYIGRGTARYKLGQLEEALQDFTTAHNLGAQTEGVKTAINTVDREIRVREGREQDRLMDDALFNHRFSPFK